MMIKQNTQKEKKMQNKETTWCIGVRWWYCESGSEDPDVVDIGSEQSMQEKGANVMHKEDRDYKNAKRIRERVLL